jgi:hypothetical protein
MLSPHATRFHTDVLKFDTWAICIILRAQTKHGQGIVKKANKKRHFSEIDSLRHTAVHEAGHAVMAVHFGFPLGSVSIESDGFYAGITETPEAGEIMTQHPDALFGLEKEILILMAGNEAVKIAFPAPLGAALVGDADDRHQIDVRVKELCTFTIEGERSAKRRLRHITGWYMADQAIRSAVVDVANELLKKTTIGNRAAKKFIKQSLEKHYRNFYPERFMRRAR